MTRPLYLLVFPTRASKINVLGTPFTGYGLEFKRNYNLSTITERFEKVLLGEVDEKWVQTGNDQAEDGKASTDVDPRDEIEKIAKRIEVPGVSREPLNPLVGRRCQEWTRELVEILVEKGVLKGSAIEVLDRVKAAEATATGSVMK